MIVGPTGAGKTEVALALLQSVKGEIISADSRQVYRGMDIGTDKVWPKIREKVPHHLIDVADPGEIFTVADFKREAERIIKNLQREDKLPVVVGGTGLYIRAILQGLFPGPGANWELRRKLSQRIKKEGRSSLYQELKKVDPLSASHIHPHDERRIIRALEVYRLTGVPISHHQQNISPYRGKVVMIGLTWRRLALYRIINQRVDKMIERGLVEEVRGLLKRGYGEDIPSMQGLGYRQIAGYLKGRFSLDEAVQLIKRDTRRLAKRQLTWFKKEKKIIWLEREKYPSPQEVVAMIIQILLREVPELKRVLK
jgi:tRNA dimethylallyltransferase